MYFYFKLASNQNAVKQRMGYRLKGLFSRTFFNVIFHTGISMGKLKKLKNAVIYVIKLKYFK